MKIQRPDNELLRADRIVQADRLVLLPANWWPEDQEDDSPLLSRRPRRNQGIPGGLVHLIPEQERLRI